MGFFSRLFGQEEETPQEVPAEYQEKGSTIPIERQGPNGEYDQSGLAKRVAIAFDNHPTLDDVETLWVAQAGTKIVLKGTVPEELISRMISVARHVEGVSEVDSSGVTAA